MPNPVITAAPASPRRAVPQGGVGAGGWQREDAVERLAVPFLPGVHNDGLRLLTAFERDPRRRGALQQIDHLSRILRCC